jgi:DNA-binding MarR family transcriptional regulator
MGTAVKSGQEIVGELATNPRLSADLQTTTEEDHKEELRIWLRLFSSTTLIENEIRRRLREQFAFTLPRFDLLAQLDRADDGLSLGEVSRRLMVSAANITSIVEKLMEDGYITRSQSQTDRRAQIIRMTHAGRSAFRTMAKAHSEWITEFLCDLSTEQMAQLNSVLVQLKLALQTRISKTDVARTGTENI